MNELVNEKMYQFYFFYNKNNNFLKMDRLAELIVRSIWERKMFSLSGIILVEKVK